jgi:protein gp37
MPPDNVMFGTSPVDQKTANTLIPQLLEVKGRKFLSVEPLIGPIDFSNIPVDRERHWTSIDWVIVGGESGHGARPIHPGWVRQLRYQCAKATVPFFFKQWGEWHESDLDEGIGISIDRRYLWPDGKLMYKIGKKKAGRTLDGEIYDQFPKPIL